MSTPLDNHGYDDLRTYVQNNWQFVAIIDDNATELLRIDIPSDSRSSFVSGSGTNPLSAEIDLTGQDLVDEGYTLPVTIASTEAYNTSSATSRLGADPFKNATLETPQDEVTITHNYRIPP